MKGISSQTGLEIEIEPFVIELDSPCSSVPPSPNKDANKHHFWPDLVSWKTSAATEGRAFDFLSDTDDESLLDSLFSPSKPALSLLRSLAHDPSPTSRAAILYYMPLAPVVQGDIPALVPSLLDDEEVMISLATNIAYYHAQGMISESELEYLLMEILVCRNREDTNPCVMDARVLHLYYFTLWQIQRYHKTFVSQEQQNEQKRIQQERKHRVRAREKNWRRKRAEAHQGLDVQLRAQLDVPLPHGCKTSADVFTDVNEMYNPSATPAPPGPNWAQSVPHSNESKGLYKTRPCINLPSRNADMRTPQTSKCIGNAPDDQDMRASKTQAPLELLLPDITIKLPDPVCYLQTSSVDVLLTPFPRT